VAPRRDTPRLTVLDSARGRGAGQCLLQAMIARAKALDAGLLYLLTSSKCETAIRLYEATGFRHDADIMHQFGARYARCDVAMRYSAPAG